MLVEIGWLDLFPEWSEHRAPTGAILLLREAGSFR